MMSDDRPTFRTLVTAFVDFLTCAVHTILYERTIYPPNTFLSTRKYNYVVRQNRHPKVCEWIQDAVTAVEAELLKSHVEKVCVVIFDKHNQPLERFVFDVARFPVVPPKELDTAMVRTDEKGQIVDVLPLVDMEEQLRATMGRLSNCGSSLKPIPPGCTFSLAIDLKETGEPPIRHPQPWEPVEPLSKSRFTNKDISNELQTSTKPLRRIEAGELIFECWIEETRTKHAEKLITR